MATLEEFENIFGDKPETEEDLIRRTIKNKAIKQVINVEEEDSRRPIGQAYGILSTLVRNEKDTKFDIIEKNNARDFERLLAAFNKTPRTEDV